MKSVTNVLLAGKSRIFLLHCSCWLVFIAYETSVVFVFQLRVAPLMSYVLHYPLNIALFYAHYSFMDRLFPSERLRVWPVIIRLTGGLTLFMLAKAAADMILVPSPADWSARLAAAKTYLLLDLYRGIYFCVLATFFWISARIATYRTRSVKARAELAEVNNAFLRQQLNPHLLLNTLNFIYSSVYRHSEEGGECVLLLSELLRYSTRTSGSEDMVPLHQEILQVRNLIAINRYRFSEGSYLNIEIKEPEDGALILPLSLLTLTENLFKHGDLSEASAPGELLIGPAALTGGLRFFSRNRKRRIPVSGSGLGLANLRLRLSYRYGGNFVMNTRDDGDLFEVDLTIQL